MEDLINEYQLQLQEVRSCIVVLQQAVQNENKEMTYCDVDNYLEIVLGKINKIIESLDNFKNQTICLKECQE